MSQTDNKYRMIGIGEVLWDMLPSGRRLGGAPANFAFHAQALGGVGTTVSAVGPDVLGQEIIQQLKGMNLNTGYITIDPDHPTGTVSVKLDQKGLPDYTINENVAWDFISAYDGLFDLAAQAQVVCFGSLAQRSLVSRDTIGLFLQHTNTSCLKIFDINIRQSYYTVDMFQQMLALSDVLKLNKEELIKLTELLNLSGSEPDVLTQMLESYDLRLIALTRGDQGSLLLTENERSEHPGFSVETVDTVGAGDAFSATLALGLLRGKTLDQINEYANRIAGYVCTQTGATPNIPDHLKYF